MFHRAVIFSSEQPPQRYYQCLEAALVRMNYVARLFLDFQIWDVHEKPHKSVFKT